MSNTTNATKAPLAFTVLSNAIEQPRWLKVVSLFVIDYIASIITLILAIALRYAKFDFHTNILSIILLGAFCNLLFQEHCILSFIHKKKKMY